MILSASFISLVASYDTLGMKWDGELYSNPSPHVVALVILETISSSLSLPTNDNEDSMIYRHILSYIGNGGIELLKLPHKIQEQTETDLAQYSYPKIIHDYSDYDRKVIGNENVMNTFDRKEGPDNVKNTMEINDGHKNKLQVEEIDRSSIFNTEKIQGNRRGILEKDIKVIRYTEIKNRAIPRVSRNKELTKECFDKLAERLELKNNFISDKERSNVQRDENKITFHTSPSNTDNQTQHHKIESLTEEVKSLFVDLIINLKTENPLIDVRDFINIDGLADLHVNRILNKLEKKIKKLFHAHAIKLNASNDNNSHSSGTEINKNTRIVKSNVYFSRQGSNRPHKESAENKRNIVVRRNVSRQGNAESYNSNAGLTEINKSSIIEDNDVSQEKLLTVINTGHISDCHFQMSPEGHDFVCPNSINISSIHQITGNMSNKQIEKEINDVVTTLSLNQDFKELSEKRKKKLIKAIIDNIERGMVLIINTGTIDKLNIQPSSCPPTLSHDNSKAEYLEASTLRPNNTSTSEIQNEITSENPVINSSLTVPKADVMEASKNRSSENIGIINEIKNQTTCEDPNNATGCEEQNIESINTKPDEISNEYGKWNSYVETKTVYKRDLQLHDLGLPAFTILDAIKSAGNKENVGKLLDYIKSVMDADEKSGSNSKGGRRQSDDEYAVYVDNKV